MTSPRNAPRNAPVVESVSDSAKYLSGDYPKSMRPVYEHGIWLPAMSKARYGLLCVAIRSPEHTDVYNAFCSVVNESKDEISLENFAELTSLSDVEELFTAEILRHSS